MNPDRIKDFSLRRAEMQQSIYGRTVTINGTKTVQATVGPITHRHRLEEGGFLDDVDSIIRIAYQFLTAPLEPGDSLVDSRTPDKTYIVVDAKDDPQAVEWVVGVRTEG